MLIEVLRLLFNRDLNKLKTEIELYETDSQLWLIDKNISNSAGNLCLHLIGNLNTYIGAELGKTGYVRDRPLEFSLKNVSKEELISKIDRTILVVNNVLDSVTEADLESIYPQIVFEKEMTTGFFLVHLSTHLAYHLGQINYHRRLII
ncbi:DinB family protein [Flavobacterium chungangense]|uniref:DinB superfamily protein n=1 Tax=Flavobacterium chungangense TaxID=554283 RepID=A0A6V6Z1S9_9FLAO|nr:DinB family protein [Flavobacterium chungangense]CAD0005691.1 DinB superfamily protein [Flavobacterium chungangense]